MRHLICQICGTFFSLSIASMLSHLVKVHRDDPNLHISCEVPGCKCTFSKVYSYMSHLFRTHKDVDLKSHIGFDEGEEDGIIDEFQVEQMDIDATAMEEIVEIEDCMEKNRKLNALFLLKTKETNLLTQKTLDDIVDGSTTLVRNTVELVRDGVQSCLHSAGIPFETIPGLDGLFAEDNPTSNPFMHVLTRNKQASYFKANFGLIEPRRITLGHSARQRRSGTKHKEVLAHDEVMYIPLLESLEKMLNKDSILTEVQNGHQRNDGMIEDFCDGRLFRTHPLFSKNATALQLMLYFDEVEVANPLGSKTGKHKLGVVYYTLGNIHPKHRSQLDAIQLLAIATTPIIKRYGIDAVLEPFMEDLERLEQDGGHQFMIKDEMTSIAGTITYISGDNLGSQLVGGFKEGSGAHLKCRQCMGTSGNIKTMFCERNFILRTRAGHDRQCQQIEQNQELSKTYGVNRRSIICNSRYFHPVNGLPGDAMHDLLEGVLPYECKEMLKVFIDQEKYFTLDQLNQRIKRFDYGYYNDRNKPSPITRVTLNSENNSLKQKAAQMWCFGKLLPLMIGNAVPDDDERWQHFMLLLKIMDIVFSPVTSVDTLGILEGLIEEYLWEFCELYPGRSVIPKMHYLVHYPSHMYNFGPMVRTWCMRYEAKHRYFKRLAGYMGNFTNVALTLADRHQAKQCYHMITDRFLVKPTVVGCGKQVVAGDVVYFAALQQREQTLKDTDILHESKKVTIHGTEYRVGAVVFTGFLNDLPEFASIDKIIVLSADSIHFLLKKFVSTAFVSHFHAFKVQREINPETVFLSQNEFETYLPAHTTKPFGSVNTNGVMYVSPRYMVPKS